MEMTIAQRKLLEFLQAGYKSRSAAMAHLGMDSKEFNGLWTACKRRLWITHLDDGNEVKYTVSPEGESALNPPDPKAAMNKIIDDAIAGADADDEDKAGQGVALNLDDVLMRRIPSPGVVAAELDSLHRALADDPTSMYTAELLRVAADYCRMCSAAHLAA